MDADVHVKDGIVVDIVDRGQDYPGETEVIEAKEALVMPGLINTHAHAAMTLFRGFADDLPLKKWLLERIFPAESAYLNPETVYYGALLACLEMISSGTTCFADGYFFQDLTIRAVHKSGLRALVAQGIIDFPAPGIEDPRENLRIGEAFLEKWTGYCDRIYPGLFCHSPLTCSEDTLQGAWELCRARNTPLQIHLSETIEEVDETVRRTGKRPVYYLDELGLIKRGLIAAHAVHLEEGEIFCLKERGCGVVHVPESNMKLSSGVPRIKDMLGLGMDIGLGTDGCASNNNMDLLQEMDTASKLSKVFSQDPVSLPAVEALKMATIGGARVMGLQEEIGTLEYGKKADIIVLDVNSPHLCPMYDPYSAVVYSATGADVRDVIVEGKVLLRNREFTTLDSMEILEKAGEVGRRIKSTYPPR